MIKQDIRSLFLTSFVKTLISNTKPKPLLRQTGNLEIVLEDYKPTEEEKLTSSVNLPEVPTLPELPETPNLPVQIRKQESIKIDFPQNFSPEQKILFFLKDPSVTGVECIGPNKNILVNKSGRIQTTSLIFTKENIDNFMLSISEKTRIPLISGVFKAIINNLIVTAVISEYVGTRFIIQKRSPF